MILPRFFRVSAIGRGSWLVWLMVPLDEPRWDSSRRLWYDEELKANCVMNPADQGTREMHDGH